MKPLPLFIAALIVAGTTIWWWSRPKPPPTAETAPVGTRPRPKSPTERLRDAMRDTDRGRRSERFASVWNGMTAEDAAVLAPELFTNEAGSPFQNDWLEFLQIWGRLDPHAALEFTKEKSGSQAADWHRAIARGWASIDPAAAAQWWLTGPTTDREGIGSTIVGLWTNTDWKAAADWVNSRVAPAEQPGLANAIAYQIVQNQPDTGKALVEACQARTTRPTALEIEIFNSLALQMPMEWSCSFKELFPVPAGLLDRWSYELRKLGQENGMPETVAKEWFLWLAEPKHLSALEDTLAQNYPSMQETLFQHWVTRDPEDASRWLAAQPPSPVREQFASTLINSMIEEDPGGARQWLASLAPESRLAFYRNWALNKPNLIDPTLEAIMKQDGFDFRRNPHQILQEQEEAEARQLAPSP